MNKKIASLIFLTSLSSINLVGCSANNVLEVNFSEEMVAAYVGEEYDFSENIVMEKGVSYSLEAYYQDYYSGEEYSLEVDGFKFTPVAKFDLAIVVTAAKGGKTAKNTTTLEVKQKGDVIDELLITDGWSGWADPGFTKDLITDERYLKTEDSHSAIEVLYRGNNAWRWGGSVLCINNFRCLEQAWTDKEWDNALITYWVYNPTEYNLEFQLRIKDNYLANGVDIDWGQPGQFPQIAAPGEWTQIFFSLKKYGVTHTLFENEEGTRKDSINIKVQWEGAPKDELTPPYSFNFFVDGLDVAPASMYPEVDTDTPDPIERIVETSWTDSGLTLHENFDSSYIKEGESSIEVRFDSSNTYNYGAAMLCLNSPKLLKLWQDKDWNDALLTFWMYNDSAENIEVALRILSEEGINIDWGSANNEIKIAKPHEWTLFTFSLAQFGVDRPLYRDLITRSDEFIVKSRYAGASGAVGRYTYHAYVDGLDIVPNAE